MYGNWLKLSLPTRALLAEQFGFKKTGSVHVSDNQVISDGYNIHEVEAALNPEAVQKFVGVEHADPMTLWQLMVDKIEGKVSEKKPEPIITPETTEPKRRGRPSKEK
jgi:hypothetical protein